MRGSIIYLFKVPWSNAYDNLPAGFENASSSAMLFNLRALYGGLQLLLSTNSNICKSFQTNDGNTAVTVPADAQTVLTNYNYVAIDWDYDIKFYFIEAVQSLYDSATNPTCRLELEYDIYMNNREHFAKLDPQLCIRSHVKDLTYDSRAKTWSSNAHYIAPPVSVIETSQSDATYMVCWGRLCTSGDLYNASGNPYWTDGCYPSQKATPYIMFPVFAINTKTLAMIEAYWQYDTSTPRQVDLADIRVNNIEEILQFDLTYYPPFEYVTDLVNGRIRVRTQRLNDDNRWVSFTRETPVYNPNGLPYVYYMSGLTQVEIPCVTGSLSSGAFSGAAYNSGIEVARKGLSPNDTQYALNAPQMQVYPIRYKSLYVNGALVPLIFSPTKDGNASYIAWYIDPSEVTPYLTITYYGGELDYQTKPIPLSNHGFMPIASSVYDSYIRANGNKLLAEQQAINSKASIATATNILSSAKGIASGNVGDIIGGAVSGMTTAVRRELALDQFYATLNDLKNAQDTYRIPTVNAMSAILQDLVLVREITPADSNEVITLFMDLTYYGFQKTHYRSVIEPTHECYDYIQTASAYFPQIPNLEHRRALETAFNRGVTMWHFDLIDHYKTHYGDAVQSMNRNVSNNQITED